jgi:hypothetical protein
MPPLEVVNCGNLLFAIATAACGCRLTSEMQQPSALDRLVTTLRGDACRGVSTMEVSWWVLMAPPQKQEYDEWDRA